MKLSKIAVRTIALALLPIAALAQAPATRPAAKSPVANSGAAAAAPGRAGGRPLGVLSGASTRPYTQQEWDEMISFLDANSPLRAKALRNPNNIPEANRLNLIRTFRAYKLIKDQNPEIAELRVQRFQNEDKLYGLQLDAHRFPDRIPQIREEIRKTVEQLVDLGLKEHEVRIHRLQSLQADEQAKLEEERAGAMTAIELRTNRILDQARRLGVGRNGSSQAVPATRPDAIDTVELKPQQDDSNTVNVDAPLQLDKK
jgi:hypothetical protein